MTDTAKLQIIESHYRGTLSEAEQAEFDNLVATDADFVQEVEDYDLIFTGFDMLHLQAFEAQMLTWEQKHKEENRAGGANILAIDGTKSEKQEKRKFNIQRFIAVAAVVAGLAFMPLAYNLLLSSPDAYTALYSAPSAIIDGVRGEEPSKSDKEKANALKAYNAKNYKDAAELLSAFVAQNGNDFEAIFFLGVAQMENKDFSGAAMNFENVIEGDKKGAFGPSAQWMLVLAQYKMGNKDLAVKFATQISNNEVHSYNKQATEFLKMVK
jgi:TolA-binding protein